MRRSRVLDGADGLPRAVAIATGTCAGTIVGWRSRQAIRTVMPRLSELLQQCIADAGTATLDVGDDWMQGRSVFGGLQAAVALRAMRTLVPELPLRTLQMTFVAPVAQHVQAAARVLRTGRSATHVEARLGGDGETLAVAIGVFGARRDSIVRHDLPPAVPMQPKAKLSYVPGVLPSFMQQFDITLLAGALPFAGTKVERTDYELGMHDSGEATEDHLLSIADFVPPVAFSWMPGPVPGSSLTWMLEILDHGFVRQPLAGWRIITEMTAARDGYISQSSTIHAPDGSAVALSRQSMVVFA
jgi:acyl-CoA thioesterase